VTRLPFPVQCVERVEKYDWIGRSRLTSRYAYHHGYFDGVEREFRGFGAVDQWDTELHREDTLFPDAAPLNEDAASLNPPVLTRTWFHTGAFIEAGIVSKQYAHEYWVEPAMRGDDPAASAAREALLLPDSELDPGLSAEERREAVRALKGSPLRVEVYGEDGTAASANPYSVQENNYLVERLQPFGPNRHAVFRSGPREALAFHYERQADDPRTTHDVTLELDEFGGVRRSSSVAYGRRPGYAAPEPALSPDFQAMLAHDQTRLHVVGTEHRYTAAINRPTDLVPFDEYLGPLPCETISAELTGFSPQGALFGFDELDGQFVALWKGTNDAPPEEVPASDVDGLSALPGLARRVVARSRTLYRSNDLTALLPLETAESLALPGDTYRLALPASLVSRIFGARVSDATLEEGGYFRFPSEQDWWIPAKRTFYSAGDQDPAPVELAEARAHFFRMRRSVDPFGAIERRGYDPYDLLARTSVDGAGNVVTADNDYRRVQPFRLTDANGNVNEVAFDCLGHVAGTALRGKAGEGDSLVGFVTDLTDAQIAAVESDPLASPGALLGSATARIVLDLFAYYRTRDQAAPDPVMLYTLTRETHVADLAPGEESAYQHVFSYQDGLGREAQHKAQAAPLPVAEGGDGVSPRWIGSGWTIYDNKGKPVRNYEPFFTATHAFEFNAVAGVSAVHFYDPLEREVAVLRPDSTFEKTVPAAWRTLAWDANDTTLVADPRNDADVGAYFTRLLGPAPGAFTSWYDRRIGGTYGASPADQDAAKDAAVKAAAHAATPRVSHFDGLGRICLAVADNGLKNGLPERYPTRTAFGTEDRPLAVIDALGRRAAEQCLREPVAGHGFQYVAGDDLAGKALYRNEIDGGERRMLSNVAGNPIRSWDARGFAVRTLYDALERPTHRYASKDGGAEILLERLFYGETHPDPTLNLKTRLFRRYDGSGLTSSDRYDFKGNLRASGKQPARLAPPAAPAAFYATSPDWSAIASAPGGPSLDVAALDAAAAALLEPGDLFLSASLFDALNRPIQSVLPYRAAGKPSVVQPVYNEANQLAKLDAWIREDAAPGGLLDPASADLHAVTSIDYDPFGQRIALDLGNGSHTSFDYDPETHRLTAVTTTRGDPDVNARTVQALSYAFDPRGNITRVRDDADLQSVVFFLNQRVDPTADYTYDAVYRLTRASGREHLGQTGGALAPSVQPASDDAPRTGSAGSRLLSPSDGNAMGNYVEGYDYDAVGNLLDMVHQVASGGWTRRYAYQEPSRIDSAEGSNRLSASSLPGDPDGGPYSAAYAHDARGNVVAMPHLPLLTWDERDRLQSTTAQVVNQGMPETTFYSYDAEGNRSRKQTTRQAAPGVTPVRKSERLYLGPLEIYREFDVDGTTVTLERETLHVLAGDRRVTVVETRTAGVDPAPPQLVRYQYPNHLGSAVLELGDQAEVISYEEYFPFGSTSYQAVRNQTDTPKRVRYSDKERDEETGLSYFGARYYAPWLGRWTACDPKPSASGGGSYTFVADNPIRLVDPDGRAECDTSNVDVKKLAPINDQLNDLVNQRIEAARKAVGIVPGKEPTIGQRFALVEKVSELGQPRGGNIPSALVGFAANTAHLNKSEIEKIAATQFPNQAPGHKYDMAEQFGQGNIRSLGPQDPISLMGAGMAAWGVRGAINPSVVLKDKSGNLIPVGTDKLGHFFAQGYEEFEAYVLQGKGKKGAEEESAQKEAGKFGLKMTGVFSNADREANKLGREFYCRLLNDPFMKFDIADYANWNLNEEKNPNIYSEFMESLLIASGKLPESDRAKNTEKLNKISTGFLGFMQSYPEMDTSPSPVPSQK
jgi:RHS repeat-associated protein